jgi:hypothetical protein
MFILSEIFCRKIDSFKKEKKDSVTSTEIFLHEAAGRQLYLVFAF